MNLRLTSTFVFLLAAPLHAGGPDKSGVMPNVLSLPTGAGSIEGLGEASAPSLCCCYALRPSIRNP